LGRAAADPRLGCQSNSPTNQNFSYGF